YRCQDCTPEPNLCAECVVATHRLKFDHRLLAWDKQEKTWISTNVFTLGHVLHLQHPSGEVCRDPEAHNTRMTLVHEHGIILNAMVRFCLCSAEPHSMQLLRHGLYPGTWGDWPRTAFTLTVMEVFEAHLLQAQSSVHDLYLILRRMTD
ncbi:uncharacterized protein BXZ73DRAFT_26906, partial [Epithele typhae]|uniref:uncharacterized protein n=1 Tax=Epithele typhae TaxID=378194 RepID=UPI00200824DC